MPPGEGKSLPRWTAWSGAGCISEAVSGVEVVRCQVPVGLGVSPLRGAGLSRCASSPRGTGVSPLTGVHP